MDGSVHIRLFDTGDVGSLCPIWNDVVREGRAFPQEHELDADAARTFFSEQSATAVALMEGRIVGLYILHPNNVGRCGHVANASYAVSAAARGKGIGRALVMDSLDRAGSLGFTGLQFNAVVASNAAAIHLYEDLGFARIGTIPGGFRTKDGIFEDMHIFYHAV